jgi:hypothetical protein
VYALQISEMSGHHNQKQQISRQKEVEEGEKIKKRCM